MDKYIEQLLENIDIAVKNLSRPFIEKESYDIADIIQAEKLLRQT